MINDEKCHNCPALIIRTPEQIRKIYRWYNIFKTECQKVNHIKVILLGESFPANRYFYDVDSNYDRSGLMFNLKKEFGLGKNIDMIEKFRKIGVIVYDCAFCPLHLLKSNADQKNAATHCLKNYKIDFLNHNKLPIITFFPFNRGFQNEDVPDLNERIKYAYNFNNLQGIKNAIVQCQMP